MNERKYTQTPHTEIFGMEVSGEGREANRKAVLLGLLGAGITAAAGIAVYFLVGSSGILAGTEYEGAHIFILSATVICAILVGVLLTKHLVRKQRDTKEKSSAKREMQ